MAARVVGLLCVAAGFLVLALSGGTVQRVGLGVWWFGVLRSLGLLLGLDGLPAQLAWMFGGSAGVYVLVLAKLPAALSGASAPRVLALPTAGLAVAALLLPVRRRPTLPDVLRELRDKAALAALPERPEDPGAEIARVAGIITGLIEELWAGDPRTAVRLSDLMRRYRSDHGTDTIATSRRPVALRNAVTVLVDDMVAVRDGLDASVPGYPQAVLAVGYARQLADLVVDRTR